MAALLLLACDLHVTADQDIAGGCSSLPSVQNWVDIGLFGALPTYLTMWCVLLRFNTGYMYMGA